MTALKTYWWYPRDGKNLGDELTTIFLRELFEVEHVQARMEDAELISTGSLLNWAWEREAVSKRTAQLSVIGTGFMHPNLVAERLDFLKIYSVRGLLSKSSLYRNATSTVMIGDPGLLSPLVLQRRQSEPRRRFGIIPHFTRVDDAGLASHWDHLPGTEIIDFRTGDLNAVMNKMLSCDIILSQSLHGLIIADSLGLPNVWLNAGPLHSGGAYKFYDYFSSVDRPFCDSLNLNERISESLIEKNVFQLNKIKLYERQEEILTAFARFFIDSKVLFTDRRRIAASS